MSENKQNFVVKNGGKGDSYVCGLDVSLKNWTLDFTNSTIWAPQINVRLAKWLLK